PKPLVKRVVDAAYQHASAHKLSPLLILAIIEQESSLRHNVVNSYGAHGLMQVVPRWHRQRIKTLPSPTALLEPEGNIQVGTSILADYVKAKDGNVSAALQKYSGNARNYSVKVHSHQRNLEELLNR